MFRLIADLFHLARVGWVFAAHDLILPDMLKSRQTRSTAIIGRFARIFSRTKKGRVGERFAAALEKLGPTYIKLGQMLSSRPDMFGAEVAGDLARLKDKLPAINPLEAEQILEAEFGANAQTLFPKLEPAIAAASIAQVHKISVQNSTKAVKIKRPDIARTIDRQIRALRRSAGWMQAFDAEAERLNPVAFIEGLSRSLQEEMDFRFEAGGCDEIGALLSNHDYFHVPAIDWNRTSQSVLTMDWVDGTPLTDPNVFETTRIRLVDREALAHKTMRGFLHLALNHGVFHADMHEGNMIVRPDGSLGLIDFGIIGRIGAKEQNYLAEILYGFIKRDYMRVAEVHFRAGYVPAHHSVGAFAQALRSIGEPVQGKKANEVSMSEVFLRLFDYTALFDMRMRPELVLLQKTMAQVEAICRTLNPQHDIWKSARPIVQKWVADAVAPNRLLKSATHQIQNAQAIMESIPPALANLEKISAEIHPNSRTLKFGFFSMGNILFGIGLGILLAVLLMRVGLL